MERKTLGKLLKWKEKKNRKPLLMTGVRQCGKTYIIKEFGKQEFEDTAYFNFDGNTGLYGKYYYYFDLGCCAWFRNLVYCEREEKGCKMHRLSVSGYLCS